MLKVNFKATELVAVIDALEQVYDPEALELLEMSSLIKRLSEVLDIDRWNPLRQLPPLGIRILLKSVNTGDRKFAVRNTLADSYAPEFLELTIDGSKEVLKTSEWYWTSEYE